MKSPLVILLSRYSRAVRPPTDGSFTLFLLCRIYLQHKQTSHTYNINVGSGLATLLIMYFHYNKQTQKEQVFGIGF